MIFNTIYGGGGGDCGFECYEPTEVFSESVTVIGGETILDYSGPAPTYDVPYYLTVNGVTLETPMYALNTDGSSLFSDGVMLSAYDYSYSLWYNSIANEWMFFSTTDGDYNIVLSIGSEPTYTDCFRDAVAASITPLTVNLRNDISTSQANSMDVVFGDIYRAYMHGRPIIFQSPSGKTYTPIEIGYSQADNDGYILFMYVENDTFYHDAFIAYGMNDLPHLDRIA